MLCRQLLLIAIVLFAAGSTAQPISEAAIDQLLQTYKVQGISLEKIYRPDFSKLYPNTGLQYIPCYPGKRLLVLVLMPEKPLQ